MCLLAVLIYIWLNIRVPVYRCTDIKNNLYQTLHLIILCTSTETSINWKFKEKNLTFFKHQISIIFLLLFCGSFFKYYWLLGVNGVFKCKKLAVHFKLTLDMKFVVLYKYLNCPAYKTIDTRHIASTNYNY